MRYYVTFGQAHTHSVNGKTFDKDCVCGIEAENRHEAHDLATEIFDRTFCQVLDEAEKNYFLHYYPKGVINL